MSDWFLMFKKEEKEIDCRGRKSNDAFNENIHFIGKTRLKIT